MGFSPNRDSLKFSFGAFLQLLILILKRPKKKYVFGELSQPGLLLWV
jgi:hypothetical protein